MILLQASDLRKYFGPEPVLDGTTVEVRAGDKIGLVGPNGTGKSTLLRILDGELESDGGKLSRHESLRLGFLRQHADFPPGWTVQDAARHAVRPLLDLLHESHHLSTDMAHCSDPARFQAMARRFDYLQHELQQCDVYHLDRKIDRILEGLHFLPAQREQLVETLSGGQQNRLLLACLLLEEPDVMLLDEPSNHLDLESTEWLEEFLIESRQACVVVSHDRYLLDKVTTKTWELLHGTVDAYRGNYSDYQRQKRERLEVQRRTFEKQQIEITRLEEFVRRNHAGQKSAQAEDRRRKLERMERVPRPREIELPPMFLPSAARSGDIVLRAEDIGKSFDRTLFQKLRFDVLRGERWGIVGPNGCGKTTLVRCLLDAESLDAGRVIRGQGVRPAYYDQRLASIPPDMIVVDAIRPRHKEMDEPARRSHLARFGLVGDIVFEKVGVLSGGERSRVALARLATEDANLLILDEPTNHLDLWARQALEEALRDFDGTVLLISHDRYFLNQVADHMIVFEAAGPRVFPSTYADYVAFRNRPVPRETPADPGSGKVGPSAATPNGAPGSTAAARPQATRRKRQFPYRKVHELEAEIEQLESRIEQGQAELMTPDVLRNGPRVKELMAHIEDLKAQLERTYAHWEEAVELN